MKLALRFCALLSFLALLNQSKLTDSARILSVAFVSSPSHKITYHRLIHTLGERGHNVTVVSPVKAPKKMKNVNEILTIDGEKHVMPNMFEMKETGNEVNPKLMMEYFGHYCSESINLPQVEALRKEKFDLILIPTIFNECTALWSHHFNTSLILLSPMAVPSWTTNQLGTPTPPSFVPNFMTTYNDKMTFYQRTMNILVELAMKVVYNFWFAPHMEAIAREKLNDPTLPSSHEIFRNASLVLSNSHISLGSPRPLLPDIVEVGGMHCRPGKPLNKDLEDFVNSSGNDGFILFSMGSALKGSTMPEKKRKMILGAFSKLKQKVLWKWETETMPDLPPNVKLSKWLPQQDVLGHPKIKAFITHGGFGSTTEAVYHGVPLVGIPMFGDQELNMQRSESSGFAVTLQYNDFTEQDLLDAINKVVTKPEYKENVMKLSSIFRDQPDKALDRAVFWVEYVLRHQGAVHLRSAARDLNFFQYHSLDVLGLIFGVLGLVLYIIFATIRFIFRKLCGGAKKPKATDSKKKKN